MLREEYLRRLVNKSYIELYLSANDGKRIFWPWRMQPPKEASKKYRNACEKYIIDSDPLDDDVTTTDGLTCANDLNAEIASLQDIYQDKDATVDALLRGLEIADSHSFDGELLLPLQEPYVECWKEIGEPTEHWLGIGGLKDASVSKRIGAVETLRKEIGPDVWVHGFGWGVEGITHYIQQNPNAIDSVDYSTPVQSHADVDCISGKERMSIVAMHAATQLVTDLRKVSPYPNHKPTAKRENSQSGLTQF